ncbi:unnamed protein product [Rodentolepis nana]|uniref:Calcium uniporter protein n=1 Tax=Rodentolepis nana TaxID=102285 RepID=A0A0R3TNI3_RODNA|nr:unnamed protein product [Rodentolepis nana]
MCPALSFIVRCQPLYRSRCFISPPFIIPCQFNSTLSPISNKEASVTLTSGGLPRFHIPLPSRDETCIFSLRPLSNTVGDLVKAIENEDKGVDRVAFLGNDGLRFAKANSIEMLLTNDFVIEINDKRFPVSVENLGIPSDLGPKELGQVRALVSRLNTVFSAEDVQAEKEREIKKRIADIQLQLEPFEEKRISLAQAASARTRRVTWLGLGAMGLQFGLLARLTWWEYSWDIMEPVTYFVGYGTTMAMYAYFVVTRQDYTFPEVFDREYLKTFYKGAAAQGFDVERYNDLRDSLAQLQSDLKRLRDPLYVNLPLQQTKYLVKEDVEVEGASQ